MFRTKDLELFWQIRWPNCDTGHEQPHLALRRSVPNSRIGALVVIVFTTQRRARLRCSYPDLSMVPGPAAGQRCYSYAIRNTSLYENYIA